MEKKKKRENNKQLGIVRGSLSAVLSAPGVMATASGTSGARSTESVRAGEGGGGGWHQGLANQRVAVHTVAFVGELWDHWESCEIFHLTFSEQVAHDLGRGVRGGRRRGRQGRMLGDGARCGRHDQQGSRRPPHFPCVVSNVDLPLTHDLSRKNGKGLRWLGI